MKCIKWLLTLATLFCVVSCKDDDEGISNFPSNPTGNIDISDAAAKFIDFEVNLNDSDESVYANSNELVISNSNDNGYDDFVENSSFPSVVQIIFNESSVKIVNSVDGVTIETDGADVVVNSSAAGVEYQLSGATSNGSFKCYSDKKFKLSLMGVSIQSNNRPAINIQSSKRAFLVCSEGTANTLVDGTSYSAITEGEDAKGCLFSEGQLIFSGKGSLTITSNSSHAIVSDEYVRFRNGCQIIVANAVKDAIHCNDTIFVGGGSIKVNSQGDGFQSEEGAFVQTGGFVRTLTSGEKAHGVTATTGVTMSNGALQISVDGSGSKGIKSDADVLISGGKIIAITSQCPLYEDNDLSSCAGIKADGNVTISGGLVAIKSTGKGGKGINCDGSIIVNNGEVNVLTSGTSYSYGKLSSSPKGMKADANLTINGGTILLKATGGEGSEGIESKSTITVNNGLVALLCYDDCMNASNSLIINGGTVYAYSSNNDGIDSNGTLAIAGGLILASGTNVPEEGFDCDQNTFKITGGTLLGIGGASSTPTANVCTQRSVIYSGTASSGQLINISNGSGQVIFTYEVPRNYNQMTLLFSSPSLTEGETYTVNSGGTLSDNSDFFGLSTDGVYSEGTQLTAFTISSMVTSVGASGGNGGGTPGDMGGGPGGRPGMR